MQTYAKVATLTLLKVKYKKCYGTNC